MVVAGWGLAAVCILATGAVIGVAVATMDPQLALAKLRFAVYCLFTGGIAGGLFLATHSAFLMPSLAVVVPMPRPLRHLAGALSALRGKPFRILVTFQFIALALVDGAAFLLSSAPPLQVVASHFSRVIRFVSVGTPSPLPAHADFTLPDTEVMLGVLVLVSAVASTLGWVRSKASIVQRWTPDAEDVRAVRALAARGGALGASGGLVAGAVVGLAEAAWCYHFLLRHATELRIFWWGPLVYGLLLSFLGGGGAFGLVVLKLSRRDRRIPLSEVGVGAGLVLAASWLIIGRFRIARELLSQGALPLRVVIGLLLGGALLLVGSERCLQKSLQQWPTGRIVGASALKYVVIVIVGIALSFVLSAGEAREPLSDSIPDTRAPNVVLIVADALRADYLTSYNSDAPAATPNLDRLTAEGVRFDRHFAQASWTKPSFATMLTGVYPGAHGAETKAAILPEEFDTLPEQLARAGYRTHGLANNRNLLPEYRLDQGFTSYHYLMPHLYFGGSFSVEQLALYQVLRRVALGWRGMAVDIEHFYQPAEAVTEEALAWLGGVPGDRPYFLMVHYMDPHDPYMRHDGSGAGYTSALLGENPDPVLWREKFEAAYAREVTYLDAQVGRLVEGIDDAIVVFTADHGEEFYEHGGWYHGPTVYEEVLRVPLIIRFPGGENGGVVSEDLARHVDLLPTVLQWAGVVPTQETPGVPLFDREGRLSSDPGSYSYAETDFLGNLGYGLRSATHKLVETNPGNPRGLPVTGFYDLTEGGVEAENLAGSGTVEERTLTGMLHDLRASMGEL